MIAKMPAIAKRTYNNRKAKNTKVIHRALDLWAHLHHRVLSVIVTAIGTKGYRRVPAMRPPQKRSGGPITKRIKTSR